MQLNNNIMEVEITHNEAELLIKGSYQPEEKPIYYDRNGDPGSPGCPEEFEISEVIYKDIDVIDLFDDESLEEMKEIILKQLKQ